MCFGDEPTIVIYGEFGIRLEDCLYIDQDGASFYEAERFDRSAVLGGWALVLVLGLLA